MRSGLTEPDAGQRGTYGMNDLREDLGFVSRARISVETEMIGNLEWSHDGAFLAVACRGSSDRRLAFFAVDGEGGMVVDSAGLSEPLNSDTPLVFAWSPIDATLLCVAENYQVRLLRLNSPEGVVPHVAPRVTQPFAFWGLDRHLTILGNDGVARTFDISPDMDELSAFRTDATFISWSPDGKFLCTGHSTGAVELRTGAESGSPRKRHNHNVQANFDIAWSPDGTYLSQASRVGSIYIFSAVLGRLTATLEGHTDAVTGVSFSADGRLLASKSDDGTLRLWRTDTWQCQAIVELGDYPVGHTGGVRFHPLLPILAVSQFGTPAVDLIKLDVETLLSSGTETGKRYVNARVVLMGESGVGKSGLGLVLSGKGFETTESTHARHVYLFRSEESSDPEEGNEIREILLWDLAGQSGYRLIHQLHLGQADVALLVFDSKDDVDPFSGVRYWVKALNHSRAVLGVTTTQHKLLVGARVDRGGIPASPERMAEICKEFGLSAYFETSARDSRGIRELASAIERSIDWAALPVAISNDLFQEIKSFLTTQKEVGRVLPTETDLYRLYCGQADDITDQTVQPSFRTCVGLLEARGLVRRLSFGGLLLLQPEKLDAYAAWLIQAALSEPDGLGYVSEKTALSGAFLPRSDERLKDASDEKLLLVATVEELLRHEIAMREPVDGDVCLIFPSQLTRRRPVSTACPRPAVSFEFEGPVSNIYATLAVRLAYAAMFERDEMWRDLATYRVRHGGKVGFTLEQPNEAVGVLNLFFEGDVSSETQRLFEDYVRLHLEDRALPGSTRRQRLYHCALDNCGYRVESELAEARRNRGDSRMRCPMCEETSVSLVDGEPAATPIAAERLTDMNRHADSRRDAEVGSTTIKGKRLMGDYDVFFCYSRRNRRKVEEIAERLENNAILPWMDVREIKPGERWQNRLEHVLPRIKVVAVFVGGTVGPWQDREQEIVIRESIRRGLKVIPVMLTRRHASLPLFLDSFQSIKSTDSNEDLVSQLALGINGAEV
ncbi:TIR domain-containing protein [Actinoplanes sp. NPDC051411]|uniref:TIR domain-containing protein n=1 Tax=Actinoplanes sp. NPDC051411 TaxID=3155522 RepID=UPI00341B29AD